MYELPWPEDFRKLRLDRNLTQKELAKRAGVSQSLIARIEAGRIDPRLSTVRKILDALKGEVKIKAEDIMRTPIISVKPEDTVARASKLMEKHGISQMPVLEDGIQIGSISEAVVVREMDLEGDLSKVSVKKVREIMNEGFPTVGKNADIKLLSRLIETSPAILIVENGNIKGIVTKADMLKLMER
jgi:predicted transcriptional regulator